MATTTFGESQQDIGRWPYLEESGAVLILLALLALVIVMFATIIIDLSAYANHREQAEEFARLAALGAIEAHFASAGPELKDRVQSAVTRANRVASDNVLLAERGTSGQIFSPALGTGTGAELIPGRWEIAIEGTSDPCGAIKKPYPCFVPVNIKANPTAQVTAYQVRGRIFERFSTKLASKIFDTAAFPVNVLATATVIPRRGCFIVDISASLTRDTHINRDPADQKATPLDGIGSEFAFMLGGDSSSSDNPNEVDFWNSDWDVLEAGMDRPSHAGTGANSWKQFFDNAGYTNVNIDTITDEQYRQIHFKSDYVSKFVPSDADYGLFRTYYELKYNALRHPFPHPNPADATKYRINTATDTAYRHKIRVDKYRNWRGSSESAGKTYFGAEPLHTVFLGLNQAMASFEQRKVAGDAACLMFVDSRLWYSRFVKMTDNFSYISSLTDFGKDGDAQLTSDPDTMRESDNFLSDANSGFERIVRHGLLPIGVSAATTNIALAVNEALTELQSGSPSNLATNFITIITDGLNNCRPCRSTDTDCTDGYSCVDDYEHYRDGNNNIKDIARDKLQGKNIAMHWILVGDAVAPHTMDIMNKDGTCMSDSAARTQNLSMVSGGWNSTFTTPEAAYDAKSYTNPFYQAAVPAYEMAVGTQGLFGPIRPAPAGCQPAVCKGVASNPSTWTRLRNDPLCRTPTQQISDYMQQIIGGNPYTLVEVQ